MKRKIAFYFLGKKPKSLQGGANKRKRQKYKTLKWKSFPRKQNLSRKKFVEKKIFWMKALKRNLNRGSPYGIRPLVKNALLELNKLPFLFTTNSGGGWFSLNGFEKTEVSIEQAQKEGRVVFRVAFIELSLDTTNPTSHKFKIQLKKWKEKKYPQATIIDGPLGYVGIFAPPYKAASNVLDVETPTNPNTLVQQSKNFMDALARFSKSFPKK